MTEFRRHPPETQRRALELVAAIVSDDEGFGDVGDIAAPEYANAIERFIATGPSIDEWHDLVTVLAVLAAGAITSMAEHYQVPPIRILDIAAGWLDPPDIARSEGPTEADPS